MSESGRIFCIRGYFKFIIFETSLKFLGSSIYRNNTFKSLQNNGFKFVTSPLKYLGKKSLRKLGIFGISNDLPF